MRDAVGHDAAAVLILAERAELVVAHAPGHGAMGLHDLIVGRAPEDGGEAVDAIEALREQGLIAFALLPASALADVERLVGLREHLERTYAEVPLQREDLCALFDLRKRLDAASEDGPARQKRQRYERVLRELRAVARRLLPRGTRVAVISRGDPAMLQLGDRVAVHFPADPSGGYAGHNPADAEDAVTRLEAARAQQGIDFLILPATASWWLEHYEGFAVHLAGYQRMHADAYCAVYELIASKSADREARAAHAVSQ